MTGSQRQKPDVSNTSGYIHTFTPAEQDRLIAQAEFLARYHHAGIDLSGCRDVLEIGCGVGAQLRLLAERWPTTQLTGVDRSESQLQRARSVLAAQLNDGRITLKQASGEQTWLPESSFDAVVIFWVFEHVADPGPILNEALRVLRPGGRIFATEVFDRALYAWPPCAAIEAYFAAFTALQRSFGGDPDVGLRMPGLMATAGFVDIALADVSPTLDARMADSAARRAFIAYFRDLLLSGAGQLSERGQIEKGLPAAVAADFAMLEGRPDAVFSYGAKQISARRPN